MSHNEAWNLAEASVETNLPEINLQNSRECTIKKKR